MGSHYRFALLIDTKPSTSDEVRDQKSTKEIADAIQDIFDDQEPLRDVDVLTLMKDGTVFQVETYGNFYGLSSPEKTALDVSRVPGVRGVLMVDCDAVLGIEEIYFYTTLEGEAAQARRLTMANTLFLREMEKLVKLQARFISEGT